MSWVVPLLAAGLIIAMVLSKQGLVSHSSKGEVQVDFLTKNYLVAQKNLLITDTVTKNVGSELALELAQKGGFEITSPCGNHKKVNLWNDEETWCVPNTSSIVAKRMKEKLRTRLPDANFTEIGFAGNIVYGVGQKETITSEVGSYTYENSFASNLRYSFEEYASIEDTARKLVSQCNNQNNLLTCLKNAKPEWWKFQSCKSESPPPKDDRKVVFCVQSPNLASVYTGDEEIQTLTPVEYTLALDFTPTEGLSVSQISAEIIDNNFHVTFPQDETADSYILHRTNWIHAPTQTPGKPDQVFATMPTDESFGLFHKTKNILKPELDDCPLTKEPHTSYLCQDKVVFVLPKDESTHVVVTSVKAGTESIIQEFTVI